MSVEPTDSDSVGKLAQLMVVQKDLQTAVMKVDQMVESMVCLTDDLKAEY